MPMADKGEFKLILETLDQKLKFLTYLYTVEEVVDYVQSGDETFEENARTKILKFLDELRSDYKGETFASGFSLNSKTANLNKHGRWIFQEFIDTPSDFYSSYRVLVDGYGHIHYSQLNVSGFEKGIQRIVSNPKHVPIFGGVQIGDSLFDLLLHPESPLFVNSLDFRSNISRGGNRILLNGDKNMDPQTRKIIEAHSLDPDNPILPETIRQLTVEIGILCRNAFPYVGIDFIQGKDGKLYFLESNADPGLNPEGLGFDKNTPVIKASLDLMDKIASSANNFVQSE
jgi:hypothetical protein